MARLTAKTWLPPFLLGFLSLAVQTLLLRQFLWRVEAAGIGVGIFLSTWLAWIGIGALVAQTRPGTRLVAVLSRRFPVALLLYLPLAVAQFFLIDHLRELAGVPEYVTSPVGHMAIGAILANAPVSLGTGLLFPAATRWLAARGRGTALAYALDTAGAVAAGVLVTALLAAGVRLEGSHVRAWQRFFPASAPGGSFATPAATYLYGFQGGTFYTLSAGGIVDMLPESDRSAEIAALLLSQNPNARCVLLLGRVPLAVVLALNEFQPRAQVTWCHDDPAYARKIMGLLHGEQLPGTRVHPYEDRMFVLHGRGERREPFFASQSSALHLNDWRAGLRTNSLPVVGAGVGPQTFLRGLSSRASRFDLVLVWPASLVSPGGAALLDRTALKQVQAVLKPDGVAALPLGGGPGAWSLEQRRLATAILANADAVWAGNGLLAPGAGCWWLAGASRDALADADTAAARFGQLGVTRFPSAAVRELYDPMRAGQLLLSCKRNATSRGNALPSGVARHGLALAWHAEWPTVAMARWVSWMESHAGMAILLLVLGAAWLVPAARSTRGQAPARLAVAWLAAGGFLGLSGLLALMQLLEVQFGDLYLLAGLASSLYLAGMFAGNRWAESGWWPGHAVDKHVRAAERAGHLGLALTTAAHGMTLLLLLPLAKSMESPGLIVLACLVAGVPAGWYVPVAIARLRWTGAPDGVHGAAVLGGDAFGSAIGGMTTSLILLPWMGPWMACLAVALFAVGVGCCATANERMARLVARIALLACLVAGGVLAMLPPAVTEPADSPALPLFSPAVAEPKTNATPRAFAMQADTATRNPGADKESSPAGRPQEVDMTRLRAQQATGALSTRKADFWEPVSKK